MEKKTAVMIAALVVALSLLAKVFILNEEIKTFMLIFFGIGIGLALLRLFVNNSIKKMKGKNWKVKAVFFAVLLGLGLPFQSWFRNEVLFKMDSGYLIGSITMLVLGMVFMTFFFGCAKEKIRCAKAVEKEEIAES